MHSFPVTESTLSATHIGLLLQGAYNMSGDTVCKLLRTGMNHLYSVTDGAHKFVFRVYTFGWRTKEEIAEEVRLLTHLYKNNVRVSYPIADNSGGYIQQLDAPEGTRHGVLYSYAEGHKVVRFTTEASYGVGVTMARMHKATENYGLKRMSYNAITLIEESLKRTRAFFAKDSDETAFLEKLTAYALKGYAAADATQIRYGAVHMDIWFDNMHFEEDGTVTIFDFDFCGNGWQCHDVAYFLYQLYSTHIGDEEYGPKAESFLKGYESITKMTDEEKRILPTVSLGLSLFFIGIQCAKFDTWSNIFLNEEHLKRYVGSLKRWMVHNNVTIDQ